LHRIRKYKNEIKKEGLQPLVIYIHGVKESNVKEVFLTKGVWGVSIIIGYGQGKPGETRITLKDHYLESLGEALKSNGLKAEEAPPGSRYCGRNEDNLNQLFNMEKHKDYYDPDVQSVQLEIAALGLRGNAQEAAETGRRLSEALKALRKNQSAKLEEPLDDQESFTAEIKKFKIDDTQSAGTSSSQPEIRKLSDLKPHPLNLEIYGDPNPDDDLKNSIQKNGILTPLIISEDGRIVSGHRRFSGAKEVGIEEVPVIIMPSCDDLDLEEKLIVANIQRQKTKEQIAREYEKLKKIESEKAKIRMSLAGGDRKSDEYKRSPTQNSAEPISKGESRKVASEKLRISHDTAEKALKVVNLADELKAKGKTEDGQKLLDTLNNKSVNSAYKKVKTILEDPDKNKAGSVVNEEQTPTNIILNRPKKSPPDKSVFFKDDFKFEDIPQKDDIEKLEFDQLKQLESEVATQMQHIQEQMNLLEKQLVILGDCAETIGDMLHDKLKDTEIALPLQSNSAVTFTPIKSNYTNTDARHGSYEREVPPGIELIAPPGYYRQNPAAAAESDEV
jgi:ParB-like chromosome segregation protein Spo0J